MSFPVRRFLSSALVPMVAHNPSTFFAIQWNRSLGNEAPLFLAESEPRALKSPFTATSRLKGSRSPNQWLEIVSSGRATDLPPELNAPRIALFDSTTFSHSWSTARLISGDSSSPQLHSPASANA